MSLVLCSQLQSIHKKSKYISHRAGGISYTVRTRDGICVAEGGAIESANLVFLYIRQ